MQCMIEICNDDRNKEIKCNQNHISFFKIYY